MSLSDNTRALEGILEMVRSLPPSQNLNEILEKINSISEEVKSANLYNPSESEQGTLNTTGGVNSSTYITTGFIEVNPNDTLYGYYVNGGVLQTGRKVFYVVSLFDENKTFKSRTSVVDAPLYIVPEGVSYIRATLQINYATYKDSVLITKNNESNEYVDYGTSLTAKDVVAREMASNVTKVASTISDIKNELELYAIRNAKIDYDSTNYSSTEIWNGAKNYFDCVAKVDAEKTIKMITIKCSESGNAIVYLVRMGAVTSVNPNANYINIKHTIPFQSVEGRIVNIPIDYKCDEDTYIFIGSTECVVTKRKILSSDSGLSKLRYIEASAGTGFCYTHNFVAVIDETKVYVESDVGGKDFKVVFDATTSVDINQIDTGYLGDIQEAIVIVNADRNVIIPYFDYIRYGNGTASFSKNMVASSDKRSRTYYLRKINQSMMMYGALGGSANGNFIDDSHAGLVIKETTENPNRFVIMASWDASGVYPSGCRFVVLGR